MAEFDLHYKELEKEAASLIAAQKQQSSLGVSKENEQELCNQVSKLDSNVYRMKKIFDSIGHLLGDDEAAQNDQENVSSIMCK